MYIPFLIGSQRCVACANFSKSEPFGQQELYEQLTEVLI